MKIGTGIGIAGLVLALIGAVTPFVGLYVGWVALLVVCIAALFGDKGLTIATVILSAIVFVFLTPSLWLAEGLRTIAVETGAPPKLTERVGLPVSLVMLASPIVCIFLNMSGKIALGKAGKN